MEETSLDIYSINFTWVARLPVRSLYKAASFLSRLPLFTANITLDYEVLHSYRRGYQTRNSSAFA